MEKLASLIAFLPSEVTGRDVYSFLALADLVRLDSAVTNRMIRRSVVSGAFAVTSVQVPTLKPHAWLDQAWSWCLKRDIHLDDMDIWDVNQENVDLVSNVLIRLVNKGTNVRWKFDVSKGVAVTNLLVDRHEIIGRISHLRLSGQPSDNSIVDLCPKMVCLRSLNLTSMKASEQTLCDIMDAVPPLVELWLPQGHFGEESLNSLLRHAATLKALSITYDGRISALLTILGRSCVHLENIFLLYNQSVRVVHDSEQDTANGLIALAKGCRRLQYVALHCPHLKEPVLLAIAQHCSDLRELDVGWCGAELTATLLLALAANCPSLCDLTGFKWCVTSLDAVNAAKPLLQRHTYLSLSLACTSVPTCAAALTLATALSYTRAESVSLSDITPENARVLAQSSLSLAHCGSLILFCSYFTTQSISDLDLLLMSVAAATGTRLRQFSIYGATVSDTAFIALAEHCPNLNRVILEQSDVTEAAIAVAVQRWSGLTHLLIAGNEIVYRGCGAGRVAHISC